VTDADVLERRYRRWLRWYPTAFRREHEAEILGVLLAGAQDGQRHPGPMECLDLMINGLRMRLRPTLSRSERSASKAVPLLYLGAILEVVAAITIIATAGDFRASEASRNLRYTDAQWSAVIADHLEPVALTACVAAAIWLGVAWGIGRGHRWARMACAIFFVGNLCSLGSGLAQGSANDARADLVIGTALCFVQLVAVVLVFPKEFGGLGRLGFGRRSNHRPSNGTTAP
jgi:hypothetical protein